MMEEGQKAGKPFYEEAVTCHPRIFMETNQRSGIHDSDLLAFQCKKWFVDTLFMEIYAKLIKEWKDERNSGSIWEWTLET